MTVFEFRKIAKERLMSSPLCPEEQKHPDTAIFIADQLIMHYAGRSFSDSITDMPLTDDATRKILEALEEKLSGKPLQYILGEWEFYGLRMFCGEGCLIPRPETEHLAEYIIKKLPADSVFLDLCTGSGCIPVAVISHRRDARCVAVDISADALCYANKNIAFHKLSESIKTVQADVAQFCPQEKYSLICSNPPYIKSDDMKKLSAEVLCEPHIALDGGDDGLDFYRIIIRRYAEHLCDGGVFAFEVGEDTANGVYELLEGNGFLPEMLKDYSGIYRVVTGKKQNNK